MGLSGLIRQVREALEPLGYTLLGGEGGIRSLHHYPSLYFMMIEFDLSPELNREKHEDRILQALASCGLTRSMLAEEGGRDYRERGTKGTFYIWLEKERVNGSI